ncbi:hypothetical protein BDZ97DRAFT_1903872 [Flammula alnicola]|nr:hypothetical protein BDZ97DRAFT_1903872 [Flammula alnicola]
MSLLVLSGADVDLLASSLSPEDLQLLMAQVFGRLSAHSSISSSISGQGQGIGIFMPPRITIPTATIPPCSCQLESDPRGALASSDPSQGLALIGDTAIKSDPRGLPATTLILDEITGATKAVVNARKLTALRNAAGLYFHLVADHCAFGAGQQIESHLDLHIRHFPSITHCTIVNRALNERAISLKERIIAKFPQITISLLASNSTSEDHNGNGEHPTVEDSVRSADIIVCATSSTAPLFPSSWVKTGAHIILIGSYKPTMREIDKLSRAGELIDAQIEPDQMKELGELVPTNGNGQVIMQHYLELLSFKRPRPVTIFKSVGIGLQDVAIASAIVSKAMSLREEKIGTVIANYDA